MTKMNLTLRPARITDRPAVEHICRTCWGREKQDYVPQVWAEWAADPHGQLVVAEIETGVVGFAKLSRLAEGEWWLEGLRVTLDYQKQGIARRLQTYLVDLADQLGQGTLRFATSEKNETVHRMAVRMGFRHKTTFGYYAAPEEPTAPVPALRRLAPGDLAELCTSLEASPCYQASHRLYNLSWCWQPLTQQRLRHHLAAGDVWGLQQADPRAGWLLLWAEDDEATQLGIGYVDGIGEGLGAVLHGARGLAAQRGYAQGVCVLPVQEPALMQSLVPAGYQPVWEHGIWLFERPLFRG